VEKFRKRPQARDVLNILAVWSFDVGVAFAILCATQLNPLNDSGISEQSTGAKDAV